MEAQESAGPYSRWSDSQDELSMTVSASESSGCERIYIKLCTGKLGIALKLVGGIILFWIIFVMGYLTGYYVHKCK